MKNYLGFLLFCNLLYTGSSPFRIWQPYTMVLIAHATLLPDISDSPARSRNRRTPFPSFKVSETRLPRICFRLGYESVSPKPSGA